MSSTDTLSDSQLAIIAYCTQHQKLHRQKDGFSRFVVFEGRFIKYGSHGSLYPQYATQQYISRFADGDASAPRIPKVYDYFTDDNMAYLVMEYIELKPTPAQDAPQRVARALQWLRGLSAPPEITIGSLGGGYARHWLFKDFEAPMPFSSIEALERYMNKARNWIRRNGRPDAVSFSGEQLVFTQSNMDESNFPDDTEGNTCFLDFKDVGLLPESFASYTMSSHMPFVKKVAEYLHWPASRNLHSMSRIGSIVQMIGDETLGLNKDGWPRSRS